MSAVQLADFLTGPENYPVARVSITALIKHHDSAERQAVLAWGLDELRQ